MLSSPFLKYDTSTPEAIRATGFPLPPLYEIVMSLGWNLQPAWRFLRDEAFFTLYQGVNKRLAETQVEAGGDPIHLVVPFAQRDDSEVVACFRALPTSTQVLILRPSLGLEEFTALPSFAEWLRLALDDLIEETDERARARRGARRLHEAAAAAQRSRSQATAPSALRIAWPELALADGST